LNSKVSADVTARLLSSAEPFHTQVRSSAVQQLNT
jgi:hypothetical protein